MSFEIDFFVENVYITQDGGLNGTPLELVTRVRDEVAKSSGIPEELPAALDEVVDAAVHGMGIVDDFINEGRFLFGLFRETGIPGTRNCEALLYAEGENVLQGGAFSFVRIATWASASRSSQESSEISPADRLRQIVFLDVDEVAESSEAEIPGIPVVRTTRIYDSSRGEDYIFGHQQDQEAIARLEVPEQLKGILSVVARAWNESELRSGQPQLSAVVEALQAQALANLFSESIPDSTPS